jgi:hypothetical protein
MGGYVLGEGVMGGGGEWEGVGPIIFRGPPPLSLSPSLKKKHEADKKDNLQLR